MVFFCLSYHHFLSYHQYWYIYPKKISIKNILTDTSFQICCIKSEPSLTGASEIAHCVDTGLTAARAA